MKEQIKELIKQYLTLIYEASENGADALINQLVRKIMQSLAPSVTDDTEHRLLNNLNVDGLRHIRDRFGEAMQRGEDIPKTQLPSLLKALNDTLMAKNHLPQTDHCNICGFKESLFIMDYGKFCVECIKRYPLIKH